jgi:hypothetical protein
VGGRWSTEKEGTTAVPVDERPTVPVEELFDLFRNDIAHTFFLWVSAELHVFIVPFDAPTLADRDGMFGCATAPIAPTLALPATTE